MQRVGKPKPDLFDPEVLEGVAERGRHPDWTPLPEHAPKELSRSSHAARPRGAEVGKLGDIWDAVKKVPMVGKGFERFPKRRRGGGGARLAASRGLAACPRAARARRARCSGSRRARAARAPARGRQQRRRWADAASARGVGVRPSAAALVRASLSGAGPQRAFVLRPLRGAAARAAATRRPAGSRRAAGRFAGAGAEEYPVSRRARRCAP